MHKNGLKVWMGHIQNEKQIFVQKQLINKSSIQKLFILQKYHLFRVNYESFSNLCDGWSKKKGYFQLKTIVWRFYLSITASFTSSSALLSAHTYTASYTPEFH